MRLEKTCCHTNSCEKPSANAGMKNSYNNNNNNNNNNNDLIYFTEGADEEDYIFSKHEIGADYLNKDLFL